MPERQAPVRTTHAVVTAGVLLLGLGVFPATTKTGTSSPIPPRVLGERITGTGGSGDSGNGKNQGAGNDKKVFTISGGVAELYPGATRPLVLTLASANNFPITVTALTVSVGTAGPGCSAGNLTVTPYTGSVVVPANGSATTTLDVTLDASAPDACMAETWALTYSGTAVKA